MKPLFAILIPYTPDRQQLLDRLMIQLDAQRAGHECIVIQGLDKGYKNGGKTVGEKRNDLLDSAREANADYIAFIDSDDLVGPTYIQRNMECVNGNFDCIELWGQYYEHGKQLNPFHHSIIHKEWWQDSKFYYRNPNHLNCIKLELLKDIRFKHIPEGEDGHYSIALHDYGLLKNQYPVNEITYYYFKNSPNKTLEPGMALKRGIKL